MTPVSTLDGAAGPPCPGPVPGQAIGERRLELASQAGIGSEAAEAAQLTSLPACGEVVATLRRQGSMVLGGSGGGNRVEGPGRGEPGAMVSLLAEVPAPLVRAMRGFIERHPNWDQYRLFQAAVAGFLVQHGVHDRAVTRCYLANLFPGGGRFAGPPTPPPPVPSPTLPSVALPALPQPPVARSGTAAAWPRRRSPRRSAPPGAGDLGRRAA